MSGPTKDTLQWIFNVVVMPLLGALLILVYYNMADRMDRLEERQDKRDDQMIQMEARISSMQGDVRYLTNTIRSERQETP